MIIVVVCIIIAALAVRCRSLADRNDAYAEQIEQLEEKISEEEGRGESIESFRKYTHTNAYIEKVAREKLGLVYPDEVDEKLDAFRDGLFYIQDPASRLAVLAAGVEPGMKVLDACAAPGGKSFALSIAMEDRGAVISCDLHPHKKKLMQAGAQRLGLACMNPQTADATVFREEWADAFDLVVADVPCSGLGVIRKKPDIRSKDPELLAGLPEVQSRIIDNVCRYVKPGGVLLYSTCTLLEEENRQIVEAFLSQHSEFSLEPFSLPEPIGRVEEGMLTLWPHRHDTDGFFFAKLRRKA